MRRFERIYDVVEPVEEYRPGGYHPIHLHDMFKDRYEVIAKLAFGQFSTVWLAEDHKLHQKVALKILKSEASKNNIELAILLQLKSSIVNHPGRKHVINLLNHFEHDGPNGTHLCLVFPVMISDGQSMTVTGRSHEAKYIQTVSHQILLGLDFLHEQGIIHCDLQPANIMFSAAGTLSDDFLQPPEFSSVRWLEGVERDNSAPQYLMASQRIRGNLDDAELSTLLIKIGDLGGATWSHHHDQSPVTPTALRAPELIHHQSWDVKIDIWALGCLIFELATNEPLFPLGSFGLTAEQIDSEHKALIDKIHDEREMLKTFTACLKERLASDFGTDNVRSLASFLISMLQRDPRSRKSTTALLENAFLYAKFQK